MQARKTYTERQKNIRVPSEGGSEEAGLSQGGQLSCLNVKLWVLLFCEMAQRCLQEQDCLSYQSFYLEAL